MKLFIDFKLKKSYYNSSKIYEWGVVYLKIVILTPEQFDNFSDNHPLHTYYQTSMYGNVMKKNGFSVEYYGFVDDNDRLVGATLLLTKKLLFGHKYAYAPRGYLINYDDRHLITELSRKLKKYLARNNYVFLKIDPPVVANKRDSSGNIIPSPYQNDVIVFLQNNGYNYFGDNKFFGTEKPRWNAILKVTGTASSLYNNFDSNIKNKIRKAQSRGVEVVQGNHNDLEIFYSFVYKKHYRKLNYYKDFARFFGNKFELYFAKLNTQNYLTNIKKIYEEEIANNDEINRKIQDAGMKNKIDNKLTNSKLTSDKLIATYKKELEYASVLFEKNPQGIIIGATGIIVEKYGVELLIEGYNPKYGLYYPNFLLKWHIIEKYSKLGAVYFHLNAITGYFGNNNKFKGLNEMKLGYNAEVTEYIGEFDLVVAPGLYKFYKTSKLGKKKKRMN